LPEPTLVDTFVVPPALGGNAGPLGAIILGGQALGDSVGGSGSTAFMSY
jgi:fructokinase